MSDNSNKGTEIRMPQLAESVVSATISKWLKQPGDFIEEYEPICEIITDKVTAELPCTEEGMLLKILVEEGATVDVGTVICMIDSKAQAGGQGEQLQTADLKANQQANHQGETSVSHGDQSMRRRYSPAVRSLADEHDIDLEELTGTGLGGRITRKDVFVYIDSGMPGK